MPTGKIGITERGDGGLDLSWKDRLDGVDGVVVVTKNLNECCRDAILSAKKPVVVHCGCTGLGHTKMEPNVPRPADQLANLKALLDAGFPADRAVLRVDPIIPVPTGLAKAAEVLRLATEMALPVRRVRFSVYDEYPHVRERLAAMGFPPFYPNGRFYCLPEQRADVVRTLAAFPSFAFESCAEDWCEVVANTVPEARGRFTVRGCISDTDLLAMGLDPAGYTSAQNIQMRHGCHCLACKTELLRSKCRCPHQCAFYWRD